VFGVVMALIYLRTGTLLNPIACHHYLSGSWDLGLRLGRCIEPGGKPVGAVDCGNWLANAMLICRIRLTTHFKASLAAFQRCLV